jgi:hypothetical protein
MIGFDFPLKPQWIHDVHVLWRPQQPVRELVQAALAQTMQELGGEKARRNTLTVILHYFVATEGSGQARRTMAQDAWAAYAQAHPAATLAPAYLAHIITENEVAHEASRFLTTRHSPGETVTAGELRRHVASRFGERKVALNAASAFLRTLDYFGALSPAGRPSEYRFVSRLPVVQPAFPLLVWAWWQRHLSPQVDLDAFAEDSAMAFLEADRFGVYWQSFQPALWVLETRLEGRRAALKQVTEASWIEALLAVT